MGFCSSSTLSYYCVLPRTWYYSCFRNQLQRFSSQSSRCGSQISRTPIHQGWLLSKVSLMQGGLCKFLYFQEKIPYMQVEGTLRSTPKLEVVVDIQAYCLHWNVLWRTLWQFHLYVILCKWQILESSCWGRLRSAWPTKV